MSLFDFIKEIRNPQRAATPTMSKIMDQATDKMAYDLKVAAPAIVIRYDKDKMLADVRPQFKKKYLDGEILSSPIIYNVPVIQPRAGGAYIHLPIKKGHQVMLVWADRSLEKWLTSGGEVDPEDKRKHHISDAVAYPGGYPFNDTVAVDNGDDVIIRNGNEGGGRCEVRVKPNNHIQVQNSTNELVKVLTDILKHIREAKTITGVGLQRLQHPLFVNDERRLRTFLES